MSLDDNKAIVRAYVETVWNRRQLERLSSGNGVRGVTIPHVSDTQVGEHHQSGEDMRLRGLSDAGWAAFWGNHRYRLAGEPAGRFWWGAGLCRFEPDEVDGYGVERI
jgi:hypothetical protein